MPSLRRHRRIAAFLAKRGLKVADEWGRWERRGVTGLTKEYAAKVESRLRCALRAREILVFDPLSSRRVTD